MNLSPTPNQWRGLSPTPIAPADAYNGYVAANVIFALHRMGLLDRIERGESVYCDDLGPAGRREAGQGVLRAAAACGYLKPGNGEFAPTEAGREAARCRGYFTWAVGGYSEVFAHAGRLASGEVEFARDVHRDEALVALGSAQADQSMYADLLQKTLDSVEFEKIADLGSGTSARVLRIVAQRPGTRGLGVDISESATRLAREDITRACLEDSVEAVQCDVLDMLGPGNAHRDVLGEVDAVMSFFLLHDLLADPASRADVLPRMREAFPRARTFILSDTMLQPYSGDGGRLPIFTAGFELAHALMGVPLHTKETYEGFFARAGLRIEAVEAMATPHSWLYVLRCD